MSEAAPKGKAKADEEDNDNQQSKRFANEELKDLWNEGILQGQKGDTRRVTSIGRMTLELVHDGDESYVS